MKNKGLIALVVFSVLSHGCSPLKSSPREERHQMELTVHEVRTNLDDLRHDLNCHQTELQIVDGKIKHQENAFLDLKHDYLEKQEVKVEELTQKVVLLEKRLKTMEHTLQSSATDIRKLSSHSNEMTAALSQYKDRMNELENELIACARRFDEVSKLKKTLEHIAHAIGEINHAQGNLYKVKPGDTLEKIARANKTDVEKLKKINELEKDLIVIGQELKLP